MRLCLRIILIFLLAILLGCERFPAPKTNHLTFNLKNGDDSSYLITLLNAELAENNGDFSLASENLLSLSKLFKDPILAKEATRNALKSSNLNLTIQSVTFWAQLQPNNLLPQFLSALYLLNTHASADTLTYVKNIFQLSPQDARNTVLILASELTSPDAKQKLLNNLQQIALQQPTNSELSLSIALVMMELDQANDALRMIDKTLQLKPNWTEAVGLKAKLLLSQGLPQQALAYISEKIKKYPHENNFRSIYALLLFQLNIYDKAEKEYSYLLKENFEPGVSYIKLGQIALAQKDDVLAENYFTHALQYPNSVNEARYLLGSFYESENNVGKAEENYLQVNNGPYFISSYIKAAIIMSKNNELNKALSVLNQLNPTGPVQIKIIILAKTQILFDANQLEGAFSAINTGIKFLPTDTDLLFTRSLVASKLGNFQSVENDLRTIIKIQPNNALALNALGFTLIENSKRYQEALTYISRALDLKPDDPSILDSMGWTWYRLGNYQNSLHYLRKAKSLSADPDIAAHLGEVLWVSGQQKEANDIWNASLQHNPNNTVLLETMQRLHSK